MSEWTFSVIYECDGCDNVFTPEKLKEIQTHENYLRELPEYTLTCKAASTQDDSCGVDAMLSPLSIFNGVASIDTITQE